MTITEPMRDGTEPDQEVDDNQPPDEVLAWLAANPDWIPEVMGTTELANAIGVRISNLGKQAGLPKPGRVLIGGRLWRTDRVALFIAERQMRHLPVHQPIQP